MPVSPKAGLDKTDNRYKWASKMISHVLNSDKEPMDGEYWGVEYWQPEGATSEQWRKHMHLNRYLYPCADQNRVILRGRKEGEDYIHASWINTPERQRKYICTQAPLEQTARDFWHMVYTEKCAVVVMLSDLKEDHCQQFQYWPVGDSIVFGEYTIRVDHTSALPKPKNNIQHQILECMGPSGAHHVCHIWSPWRKCIAPLDPSPLIALHREACQLAGGLPMVVHSEEGINRSAVFIGMDIGMSMIRASKNTTMVQIFKEVRSQRLSAFDSPENFELLRICLLESIAQDNLLPRKIYEPFLKMYQKKMVMYNKAMEGVKKRMAGGKIEENKEVESAENNDGKEVKVAVENEKEEKEIELPSFPTPPYPPPSSPPSPPPAPLPIRQYIDQTLYEVLHEGLIELSQQRPPNPIEWLANWLMQHK